MGKKAESLQLKVAEPGQQDVGRGIVRLGRKQIKALALGRDDIVEIRGKRNTASVAVPGAPEDAGLDIVRMDGLLRHNAKVGIGDTVEIGRAEWKEARKVVLPPAKADMRIQGTGDALRPTLLHRPLVEGDLISTSVSQGRDAAPRDVFAELSVTEEMEREYEKVALKIKQDSARIGFVGGRRA